MESSRSGLPDDRLEGRENSNPQRTPDKDRRALERPHPAQLLAAAIPPQNDATLKSAFADQAPRFGPILLLSA
jgi:hypothetical protein